MHATVAGVPQDDRPSLGALTSACSWRGRSVSAAAAQILFNDAAASRTTAAEPQAVRPRGERLTRSEQIDEELALFERFRAATGLLVGRPVVPQEPPEPDIAVTTDSGIIGIELTELVTGPFQRGVESAQDRTLARAEELYTSYGGPPIFVTLYWWHSAGPRRLDAELAEWIAQTVFRHLPPGPSNIILDTTEPAGVPMDHDLVQRIDITRLPDDPASGWSSPRHWWPGRIGHDWIQRCIEANNEKPGSYTGAYAATWLVISATEAPSSGFILDDSVFAESYASAFDKVFLAAYSDSKVGPLPTRPRP